MSGESAIIRPPTGIRPPPSARGTTVGVDIGRRWTKIVVLGPGGRRDVFVPTPPSQGSHAGDVLLADVVHNALGSDSSRAADGLCLVVAQPSTDSSPGPMRGRTILTGLSAAFGTDKIDWAELPLCVAASGSTIDEVSLVCDVGVGAVTVALCVRDSAGLRLLDREVDSSLSEHGTGEFLRAMAEADRSFEQERQLVHRAEIVLDRAMNNQRYLRTPVFGTELTAEAAAQLLQPVGAAAAGALTRLLARVWESPAGAKLVLSGGFAGLASIREAVRASAAEHGVIEYVCSGVAAAAHGAALIAAEVTLLQREFPPPLRLRARQLRSGLLKSIDLPLRVTGQAPFRVVREDGTALTVHVGDDDAEDCVSVQVLEQRTGRWCDLSTDRGGRPTPGRYRLALHPGQSPFGVLTLHPLDGGTTVVVPLAQISDGDRP